MSCEEIREMISAMTDNELSEDDRALLMEHLAACPECMKVYEAFASVSEMLSDLEEVPEGFTDSVMQKLRAKSQAPKRKISFLRVAGLAACLALILFSGRNLSVLRLGAFNSSDPAEPNLDTAKTGQEVTSYSLNESAEDITAKLMDYGYVTLENDSDFYNNEAQLTTISQEKDDPSNQVDPEESEGLTFQQQSDVARTSDIQTLLQVASDAEYGLFPGEPDYTATFFNEDGSSESLSIWVTNGSLYCADDETQTAYYAVCSPEEFLLAFGQ